ncbi:MAG: DUF6728 family protein [Bacteroidota bacterium]
MGFWQKFGSYISFRRQEVDEKHRRNFNLRAMHTINKISIFMFIAAGIFLFVKWVIL